MKVRRLEGGKVGRSEGGMVGGWGDQNVIRWKVGRCDCGGLWKY